MTPFRQAPFSVSRVCVSRESIYTGGEPEYLVTCAYCIRKDGIKSCSGHNAHSDKLLQSLQLVHKKSLEVQTRRDREGL